MLLSLLQPVSWRRVACSSMYITGACRAALYRLVMLTVRTPGARVIGGLAGGTSGPTAGDALALALSVEDIAC